MRGEPGVGVPEDDDASVAICVDRSRAILARLVDLDFAGIDCSMTQGSMFIVAGILTEMLSGDIDEVAVEVKVRREGLSITESHLSLTSCHAHGHARGWSARSK